MVQAFLTRKRDVTREVESLMAATKDVPRGGLVEIETIATATGYKRAAPGWSSIVSKWKQRMVRERGIWVKSVPGVGYRLLGADEQLTQEPEKLQRAAERKLKRAAVCAGSVQDSELDETARAYREAVVAQQGETLHAMAANRAKQRSWLAAPQTMPKMLPVR